MQRLGLVLVLIDGFGHVYIKTPLEEFRNVSQMLMYSYPVDHVMPSVLALFYYKSHSTVLIYTE